MTENKREKEAAVVFGAAAYGSAAAAGESAAADAMREGMDLFREASRKLLNVNFEQKKGNLFEYIEAAKFNADSARKYSDLKAVVTAASGKPLDPADIEIQNGAGNVLQKIQAKASKSTTSEARLLSNPKYKGMGKLVPTDQAEKVRRISRAVGDRGIQRANPKGPDFVDTANTVAGQIDADGISSGGSALQEIVDAAKSPRLYALQKDLKALGKEASVSGGNACLAGAVMGGAISLIRNTWSLSQGKTSGNDAALNVAKDTIKDGARSGAAGAGGAIIRHAAAKTGLNSLTKSNVATAMAASVIEVGATVFSFSKGEITAEEAGERIGQTSCSAISGIYVGAAAGAIFGPPGAVVGSVAGYLSATTTYQSCMAILKEATLAEEEASRTIALCTEATLRIDLERRVFEKDLAGYLKKIDHKMSLCFHELDRALERGSPYAMVQGLSGIVALCGRELQFAHFEDFDDFMIENREPLRI